MNPPPSESDIVEQPLPKETAGQFSAGKLWSLWFIWGLGLAAVIMGGTQPDQHHYAASHSYPWSGVMRFSFVVTIESMVLGAFFILTERESPWKRSLGALLLVMGLIVPFFLADMHSPPYQHMHLLWLLAVGFILLISTLLHLVATMKRRVLGNP